MPPLKWTHSVRAIRDTPVRDHSVPDINKMRPVVYCAPIAVSLFFRVQLVTYFKWSPWHCAQLWPYVGMGSLGMRLNRDCNGMGDAAKISPRIPSPCTQNAILPWLFINIIPSCQIYVAIDNPSLVPSVSSLTTGNYLCIYVRGADHVFHAGNLQSSGCQCFPHLYKFRDRIQVTRVFRYWGERQGEPVLNENSILV